MRIELDIKGLRNQFASSYAGMNDAFSYGWGHQFLVRIYADIDTFRINIEFSSDSQLSELCASSELRYDARRSSKE